MAPPTTLTRPLRPTAPTSRSRLRPMPPASPATRTMPSVRRTPPARRTRMHLSLCRQARLPAAASSSSAAACRPPASPSARSRPRLGPADESRRAARRASTTTARRGATFANQNQYTNPQGNLAYLAFGRSTPAVNANARHLLLPGGTWGQQPDHRDASRGNCRRGCKYLPLS